MSVPAINSKRYALLVKATGEIETFHSFQYEGTEPGVTGVVDLTGRTDLVDQYVSDDDLGGLSEHEFRDQKYGDMDTEVFQGWLAKAAAPSLSVTPTPKNDGSVTGVLGITGGLAGVDYRVSCSRAYVSFSPDTEGTLDGAGADSSISLKVFGDSAFVVEVRGVAFLAAQITVTPGAF